MSGALERQWATELRQLNRDGGQPGVTQSPQALQIAEAIKRLQTRSLEMLNAEGASVRGYDSYISRTSHSPDRLLQMRVEGFLALAYQHFDLTRMYPNRTPEYIEQALRRTWAELVDGGTAGPEGVFQATTRNVADAVSQSRSIHFASADAWLDYMAEVSDHSASTVVINSALRAARDAGLMRIMGSNPKHSLETDFARALTHATANGDVQAMQRLEDSKDTFDRWLSLLDGSGSKITNRNWAAVTQNILTTQRLAKLGFLPISQLTDLASIWSEARYQGVPIVPRALGVLGSYLRGSRSSSEKREVADLLGAALDGWLGHLGVMLENSDPQIAGSVTGTLSRWQNIFFRLTGASWLTDSAREGAMAMSARHLGMQRGRSFAALGEETPRIMLAFGVGEHEWQALSRANWTVGREGRTFLIPGDAQAIPEDAISAYIAAVGRDDLTPAEARNDIGLKLRAFYADRRDYSVLNPGVRERAALYQGTSADSAFGMALRLGFQFKSFMVSSILRQWGREIYGQQAGLNQIFGIAQFMTGATVLGMASNAIGQAFKGQDPTSQWESDLPAAVGAGFLRGGAASIAGDFLFGELGRHGTSFGEYAAGPTGGYLETARCPLQGKAGRQPGRGPRQSVARE
jgi:hypothetical protein